MRKKIEACKIWLEICNNCKNNDEMIAYHCFSVGWKDTLKFIEKPINPADKFSLATLSKDTKAVQSLYTSIRLNDYQKSLIKKLQEKNEELLLTLNPYVLDTKYAFLTPVIDELVIDTIIQDKLLSLDDYELSVLKRITEYCIGYGINPNKIISIIIDNIGFSSIPAKNDEKNLDNIDSFFRLLQNYENTNGKIDKKMLGNIAVILKTGICVPTTIDEIVNYNDAVKNILKEQVNSKDISLEELKENIIWILFAMDLSYANYFVKAFNTNGVSSEYYTNPGFIELLALKMLLETDDIEKLKNVAHEFIHNPEYEINLFNNNLMEENLLLLYAREFNKCKPRFEDDNLMYTIDGIRFYDSLEDFYAIVKSLGVFYHANQNSENYCENWNNKRYRSHVNAVSLIRNDNLAFAEADGNIHIKLGFLNFDEKKQYDELVFNSIKAAKDFENISILVINREKIAKNEINTIRTMLDDYSLTHNIELLKKIIIRFNNNRNGCRGPQHKYIRENYFSNKYFENLLSEIDDNILDEHRQEFKNFVITENKTMAECSYDNTTLDLPIMPNKESQKRGGLNV